jgi:hypothetical protein
VTWQEDAPPATEAAETDVRPDPNDDPVGRATGVLLAQAHNIVDLDVERHQFLPERV